MLSDVTDQALQYVPSVHKICSGQKLEWAIRLIILMFRNGLNIITKSLSRVAKKSSPNDIEGFTKNIMANITTTTDAYVSSTTSNQVSPDEEGGKLLKKVI